MEAAEDGIVEDVNASLHEYASLLFDYLPCCYRRGQTDVAGGYLVVQLRAGPGITNVITRCVHVWPTDKDDPNKNDKNGKHGKTKASPGTATAAIAGVAGSEVWVSDERPAPEEELGPPACVVAVNDINVLVLTLQGEIDPAVALMSTKDVVVSDLDALRSFAAAFDYSLPSFTAFAEQLIDGEMTYGDLQDLQRDGFPAPTPAASSPSAAGALAQQQQQQQQVPASPDRRDVREDDPEADALLYRRVVRRPVTAAAQSALARRRAQIMDSASVVAFKSLTAFREIFVRSKAARAAGAVFADVVKVINVRGNVQQLAKAVDPAQSTPERTEAAAEKAELQAELEDLERRNSEHEARRHQQLHALGPRAKLARKNVIPVAKDQTVTDGGVTRAQGGDAGAGTSGRFRPVPYEEPEDEGRGNGTRACAVM